MLTIKLMNMKFNSDEFQQVLLRNDDTDRHAGIFDYLFRHCGHPLQSALFAKCIRQGQDFSLLIY